MWANSLHPNGIAKPSGHLWSAGTTLPPKLCLRRSLSTARRLSLQEGTPYSDAAKMGSGGTNHCSNRPKMRQEAKQAVLGRLVNLKSAKRKVSKKPLSAGCLRLRSTQFNSSISSSKGNLVYGGLLLPRTSIIS